MYEDDDRAFINAEVLSQEELWEVIDMLVDTLECCQEALQNGFVYRGMNRLNLYSEVARVLAAVPEKPDRTISPS